MLRRVRGENGSGARSAGSSPSPTPSSPDRVIHTSIPSPRIAGIRSHHPTSSSLATCLRTTRSTSPKPRSTAGIGTTPRRPMNRPTRIDPGPVSTARSTTSTCLDSPTLDWPSAPPSPTRHRVLTGVRLPALNHLSNHYMGGGLSDSTKRPDWHPTSVRAERTASHPVRELRNCFLYLCPRFADQLPDPWSTTMACGRSSTAAH